MDNSLKRYNKKLYKCPHCKFLGTKSDLKQHRESKHEGIRFSCHQCDYQGSKGNLKQHREAKHEGVRYPCKQCDYKAQRSNLKRHVQIKHEVLLIPSMEILKKQLDFLWLDNFFYFFNTDKD